MTTNDPLIGERLGDYNIQSVLGQGGMARVYKGYDETLDRYAAVKVIEPKTIASEDEEEYRERFLREARSIARLNHPRIVAIYQFGQNETRNLYYMAMSFVNGRDLRQILKEYNKRNQRLSHTQVSRIVRDIAGALDYAHAQGVIHRDVKPSNIMVMRDGHAVITDFGLALNAQEGTIGNTFGSVHYIAPEQAVSSAQAVPQSDFYSLGVVLFEMLTGRVPFEDVSAMSVALKHISDPPPMPSALNVKISAQVEDVILKALDKDPQKRFRTGMEFVHALEGAFAVSDDEDTHELDADKSDPKPIPTIARPDTKNRSAEVPAIQLQGSDTSQSVSQDDVPTISDSRSKPDLRAHLAGDEKATRRMAAVGGASRRTGLMLSAAVIIILLLLVGVLISGVLSSDDGDGEDDNTGVLLANSTASSTALAVVADATEDGEPTTENTLEPSPDETKSEPTGTSTPIPTAEPTDTPAPTETETTLPPTETVAPTETESPTDVPLPTATPTPDTAEVLLRYDGRTLTLYNRSQSDLNVIALDFVRLNADGTDSSVFEAREWNVVDLTRLRPENCLQVWTVTFSDLPSDEPPSDICLFRQGTWQTSRAFWVTTGNHIEFEVRNGATLLATCPVVPRSYDLEPDDQVTECLVPLTASSAGG